LDCIFPIIHGKVIPHLHTKMAGLAVTSNSLQVIAPALATTTSAAAYIISMASIYLQPSVHAIHNPPCQYRESPALNSTQFKHSTPEKEIAISSSTLFKIP
jgi:hypothetical protein